MNTAELLNPVIDILMKAGKSVADYLRESLYPSMRNIYKQYTAKLEKEARNS